MHKHLIGIHKIVNSVSSRYLINVYFVISFLACQYDHYESLSCFKLPNMAGQNLIKLWYVLCNMQLKLVSIINHICPQLVSV